jgi:hypothetical protein
MPCAFIVSARSEGKEEVFAWLYYLISLYISFFWIIEISPYIVVVLQGWSFNVPVHVSNNYVSFITFITDKKWVEKDNVNPFYLLFSALNTFGLYTIKTHQSSTPQHPTRMFK